MSNLKPADPCQWQPMIYSLLAHYLPSFLISMATLFMVVAQSQDYRGANSTTAGKPLATAVRRRCPAVLFGFGASPLPLDLDRRGL